MRTTSLTLLCALAALALPGAASAATADKPWPPASGDGRLFVHFGEEHVNDEDGATLLPKVVDGAARYKPDLVTMSGDKANDGENAQFQLWQDVMKRFDEAGVPYLAGMGNHDRNAPPGVPGGTIGLFYGTTPESIEPYRTFFKDRPYPWGDGKPYPGIGPAERPSDDPTGASTHYTADVGDVRWIFLDNSCFSLTGCDDFQQGSDGDTSAQFDYLRAKATEASAAGKAVFVVMHMPTFDPRDQSYTDETARNHVMQKGFTSDNALFEEVAEAGGVDGVFVGHIKGQFQYKGRGGVPYFIDGGAGGELYTTGPVGADHGYWHGYRVLRTAGGKITSTDTVPIFVEDGITLTGPESLARGETAEFAATGRQPVFKDPAKVERLELRDPNPTPPTQGSAFAGVAGIAMWAGPLLLLLGVVAVGTAGEPRRRARRIVPLGAAGALAVVGVAVAQQGTPTSTPRDALPIPARIFETGDARILAPVASENDDPRRDVATQTEDGRFTAACPGRTTVRVTSGWETTTRPVTVASSAGRIATRIRGGAARVARGKRVRVASVRLAQPAIVRVRVHRRGAKAFKTVSDRCVTAKTASASWVPAARGRYTVKVAVLSDRKASRRTYDVRVR